MLKDLNILLDLGFWGIYDNDSDGKEIIGYKLYLEDLNGFIIIDLNGDLHFGLEYKNMDNLGNITDIEVRNIQEIVPSLRYYLFKKISSKKNFGFIDKFKGIFARDVNA